MPRTKRQAPALPFVQIILAWLILAFWGVLAREVATPLPILLFFVCVGGLVTCVIFLKSPITWTVTSFWVALVLVIDLLLLFAAFQILPFAITIALHYVGPVLVVLLAPVFLGERVGFSALVAALTGFAAAAALVGVEMGFALPRDPAGIKTLTGLGLALLSAVTLAANIMLQRLNMRAGARAAGMVFQYNLYMTIISALLIPFWIGAFSGGDPTYFHIPARTALMLVAAGAATQGAAMLLFNSAARALDSQTIARMSFLEVAFVAMLGAVLYNERLGAEQWACIALIVAMSIAAKSSFDKRRAP